MYKIRSWISDLITLKVSRNSLILLSHLMTYMIIRLFIYAETKGIEYCNYKDVGCISLSVKNINHLVGSTAFGVTCRIPRSFWSVEISISSRIIFLGEGDAHMQVF